LPRGGPNTILVNALELARFGISKSDLIRTQAGEATYPLAKTCISYLLSNSLLEEASVALYRSQFGRVVKPMLFTTRGGFDFLRSYLALAKLAGALGEPQALS
jgi:hypothetical protein